MSSNGNYYYYINGKSKVQNPKPRLLDISQDPLSVCG
jgi:hypothetical protein